MPDYLSPSSLDWALAHIRKFGDTDIFPVPFEIKPIADRWQEIRKHLEQVNLSTYSVQAAQRILMPKSRVGFRVATQLDPIDSIVYAAIIYEAAPAIEKYRVPKRLKTVFSYRIKPQSDGSLFAIDEYGWQGYHERSSKLAHSGKTNFVLTADIADFYNHIYHHRVNNFLQSAGVPIERTKNIESFLSQLSAKHSRGVPVGPFPSIALAEATLDDVDKFLLSRGITYVRYVDDFRIFTKHKSDAILASHDLTEYLYTAHRLALASAKTGLYAVKTFI